MIDDGKKMLPFSPGSSSPLAPRPPPLGGTQSSETPQVMSGAAVNDEVLSLMMRKHESLLDQIAEARAGGSGEGARWKTEGLEEMSALLATGG